MALTANINSNTSGFDKGIAKVRRDIKSLDNIGSKITLGSFAGSFAGGIAGTVGSAVLSGITTAFNTAGRLGLDFTLQSISKAMDIETATMQFEVFLKSAKAAEDVVASIKKTSATTPFEFPGLADAAKALIAAEVPQTDLISTLRMLGDIAAGTGADLSELAKIYGQVKTKGILQTERFNQFLDRSINLTKALAKVTGTAEEEIGDLMSSGEVSFTDFNKAMQSLVTSGGTFENMMIKLSSTTEGKMSTMKDSYSEMQKAFGKPLLPSIQSALDELTRTFEALEPELQAAGQRLGGFLEESFRAIKFRVEPSYFDDLANALKLSLGKAIKEIIESGVRRMLNLDVGTPGRALRGMQNVLDFVGKDLLGIDPYFEKKVVESVRDGSWRTKLSGSILNEQDPKKFLSRVNEEISGQGEKTRIDVMSSLFEQKFGRKASQDMLQSAADEPVVGTLTALGDRMDKYKGLPFVEDFLSKIIGKLQNVAGNYFVHDRNVERKLSDPEVNHVLKAWERVFPLKPQPTSNQRDSNLSQLWNNANTPLLLNPAQSGSELNGDLYRTVFKDLLDVNKKIETNTGVLRNYSTFK